jgi:hypothetical protein
MLWSKSNSVAIRIAFLLLLLTPLAFGAPQAAVVAAQAEAVATQESGEAATPQAAPLSEAELAELAALDEQPADDVVGGALSNEHLTYIAIALAAAVIVLIAK